MTPRRIPGVKSLGLALAVAALSADGRAQNLSGSSTTLTSSSPTLTLPGNLTLTSTVASTGSIGGVPTGQVEFNSDGSSLGSATLSPLSTTWNFPANGVNYTSNFYPNVALQLTLADIFRTGSPALIIAGYNQSSGPAQVTVYPNAGQGAFTASNSASISIGPYFGGTDALIEGNFFSTTSQSLLALASGDFYAISPGSAAHSLQSTHSTEGLAQSDTSTILAADFNGDGYSDVGVLLIDYAGNVDSLGVVLNNGNGSFGSLNSVTLNPGTYSGRVCANSIAPITVNAGQGAQLAVLSHITAGSSCALVQSNSPSYVELCSPTNGTCSAPQSVGTGQILMATGDFNGDGKPDLVFGGYSTSNSGAGVVQVYTGDGSGSFSASPYSTQISGIPVALNVADFNVDGASDLEVSLQAAGVTMLLGNNTGAFPTTISHSLSNGNSQENSSSFPALAPALDVNGDGLPDTVLLYSASSSSNVVTTLLGSESSRVNFTTPTHSLPAGNHTLVANYPGDLNFQASSSSLAETVVQTSPSASWVTPASIPYPTPLSSTQLDASASVAGAFAYLNGAAPVSAGTVLPVGSHLLSANFTPTDTFDYTAASAQTTLVVTQATPTVSWPTPGPIAYNTPLSAAQLDATASVPGTFAYTNGGTPIAPGTVLGVGSHLLTVTFTPSDTTDYSTATAQTTLVVNQATPTVTWTAPASITYGTPLSAAQLDATASVPGTFVYMNGATPISAGTVLGAGTHVLTVTFTPTDTSDYSTATAQTTLVISRATPTVSWPPPAAITYGTPLSAAQLDATASVPGTFAYTNGSTPIAAGTELAAGTYTLTVTFTPTDTTDYVTGTAQTVLVVNQANSLVTWPSLAAITYGTPLSASQLDATATVPGTFAYSSGSAPITAGTVLSAGTHVLSVTFTPTNSSGYSTTTVQNTLLVNQATPTVSWATPAAISYGTPLSAVQLDATANVPGAFVYTNGSTPIASGTVLNVGTYTLNAAFTPTDTADYKATTTQTTLQVTSGLTAVQIESTINPGSPLTSATPTEQANIAFNVAPHAADETAVVTISFADASAHPAPSNGSVFFVNVPSGTDTLSDNSTMDTITIPAGTAGALPMRTFAVGDVAGTITVNVSLSGPGLTPEQQTLTLAVTPSVPLLQTVQLTPVSGGLQVVVIASSSTREVSSATFQFTAAPGHTITNPTVTVNPSTEFTQWFTNTDSAADGSAFTYTQPFTLNVDPSDIQSVTVTLTNGEGISQSASSQ